MPTTRSSRKPRKSEVATAYHEAGHVVAHVALHLPFLEVSILPTGNTLGQCTYKLPPQFNPELDYDLRNQRRCEHIIIAALAGHAAERRFMRRSNWPQSSHDLALAANIALYMAGSSEAASAYVNWLRYKADGLIGNPGWWSVIEALASELLRRRRMSSRQARTIIREAKEAIVTKYSVKPSSQRGI